MRLHRRLNRIAAFARLSIPRGISVSIAYFQVEQVLADPAMRVGLQGLAHEVLLLIDQLANDLVNLMVALGVKEAR